MNTIFQKVNLFTHPESTPVLAFFDFAAAFPSVAHCWIFLCLEYRGFPNWFITFIRSLYEEALAVDCSSGQITTMFAFASGVLQGCPASAFLFAVCLDPFLVCFEGCLSIRARGAPRACADDLGAALKEVKHLRLLEPIFGQAFRLAGLTVKPAKCVLVLLTPFMQKLCDKLVDWLRVNLPTWAKFKMKAAGKYLGFYLGPEAGAIQWKDPLEKFRDRVDCIYRSGVAVSVCAYT